MSFLGHARAILRACSGAFSALASPVATMMSPGRNLTAKTGRTSESRARYGEFRFSRNGVMNLKRFQRALLLLALGLPTMTMSLSSASASLDDELKTTYPKAPKKLETNPAESSVLLVDLDLHGIIRLNRIDGAALERQGDGGAPIRAGTMKGRLVLFHDIEPGRYSLQFVKMSNGNVDVVLQKPPTVQIDVTVAKGDVSYLGTVVVTKKFGPDQPVLSLAYDSKREMEAWSTFKAKYADSPWSAVADRRIESINSPAKPQESARGGTGEQDDPLRSLAGDWGLTAFVIGRGQLGGPRCGKTDRPGPPAVTIAPPAQNAVSLAVSCDDGSDYAFRLRYDPAVHGYLLTVKSKAGISVDDFPVAFVADHGWKAERDELVGDGRKVPVTATVAPIEGRNWYGWAIAVLPTADVDRDAEDLETAYFRADLTRRRE